MKAILSIVLFILFFSCPLWGQEADAVYYGRRYVSLNITELDKYSNRIDRQQQKLLSKLSNQEQRFKSKLIHSKDSLLAQTLQYSIGFDSISKLRHPDSTTLVHQLKSRSVRAIDSLKAIQSFVNSQGLNTDALSTTGKMKELQALQQKLAWQQYLNELIEQRGKQLQSLASEKIGGKLSGLTSIQKTLYYGKGKMAAYKQMADDPSLAEEKALEYLEGTEGFNQALQQSGGMSNGTSMQSAKTVEDLERMGFQTKRQVNAGLKEKFGEHTDAIQQSMTGHVADWQKTVQTPLAEINKAKQQVGVIKNDIAATTSGIKSLKQQTKLSFKPNPMRSLPFIQRLEKSYSWNVRRADGATHTPAMLEGGAMIDFKHTPKLSYGIGVATSLGLGKDWNSVHLSLEGVGMRSYASWQLQWGIGAYAGFERLYKKAVFKQDTEETPTLLNPQKHQTAKYSESVLLGLTKSYRINSKWNGAVQVLYDTWWKEKNLTNPIIIRFNTGK